MAKKKPKTEVATRSSSSKKNAVVSRNTRKTLAERNASKVKVSSGIKTLAKAKFHVVVSNRQLAEKHGILAEQNEDHIVFKSRPMQGASRKEVFIHLDRKDIVLVEGKVGKPSRVVAYVDVKLAEYKNCSVKRKGEVYEIKTDDGETVTVFAGQGVNVSIQGEAE